MPDDPSEDYRDLDRPPLRPAALRAALVGEGTLWTEVRVLRETGSTNADVAAAARAGAPEGLVVAAEHQVAGRGRLTRTWTAPPRSGLAVSVLLRPDFPRPRWGWLPLLAGVAVADPLRRLTGLDLRLKWPNDVLVGERKLAGVLAEVVDGAVVVGIGLNVTLRPDELPTPQATSLTLEGSEVTDRDPVLRAVLRSLADGYRALSAAQGDAGASGLRARYAGLCATVGAAVDVELPDGTHLTGTATEVDGDGCLVVAGRHVAAGDVVHLR